MCTSNPFTAGERNSGREDEGKVQPTNSMFQQNGIRILHSNQAFQVAVEVSLLKWRSRLLYQVIFLSCCHCVFVPTHQNFRLSTSKETVPLWLQGLSLSLSTGCLFLFVSVFWLLAFVLFACSFFFELIYFLDSFFPTYHLPHFLFLFIFV